MMAAASSFGRLIQLGYVVPDFEKVIAYWVSRGVGPFFEMRHLTLPQQTYRREPTNVDISVAISYSGPIQIELIRQHNDAPSLYRDFLAERPEGGLHHLAFLTEQLDEAIARGESLGTPVAQQWTDQLGGRYAYLYRPSEGEPYVELIEATPTLLGFFEQIEKTCSRWDGEDPHRVIGA